MNPNTQKKSPQGIILVVNDSAHDWKLLFECLEKEGYHVRRAADCVLARQNYRV